WSALATKTPTAEAAFRGRNGRIAFSAGQYVDPVPGGSPPGYGQVRDYDIFTISPGGSALQQVTEGEFTDALPAWSPDGRRIAFARADAGSLFEYDIYVVDADGGSPIRLTNTPEYRDWEPAWSPDGSKIVFRSDRAAPEIATRPLFDFWEGDLFVMNADGSDVVQLTSGPDFELMPSWSPDGACIAFADINHDAIGPIRPDGTDKHVVSTDTHGGYAPEWSPDGTRIAYARIRGAGTDDVMVIDLRTEKVTNLTEDEAIDRWPVWSPDGRYISFVSDRSEAWALYRMDADGKNLIRLVNIDLPGDAPIDWEPRP
ncbi:MAG: hypothetical protein ABR505_05235, partial [Actinomycetota bacterium]